MALLLREMAKSYQYAFTELSDPRTHNLPLIASPLPMLAIIGCYIYFVTSLGPRWMKNREPFVLDRVIQVYNAFQIVVSIWIAYKAWRLAYWFKYNWLCEETNYSYDVEPMEITVMSYVFFSVKIVDLLDTVFFVLRKKTNQISFLHLYHHANMVWAAWIGVKYFAGGHVIFIGLLNSMVHSVMYSYYLMTSLYPQQKKNMWWKKYITQMQMIQFLLICIHNAVAFLDPACGFPKWINFILVPQTAFMAAMFYDFYRKAYSGKVTTQSTEKSK